LFCEAQLLPFTAICECQLKILVNILNRAPLILEQRKGKGKGKGKVKGKVKGNVHPTRVHESPEVE